MSAFWRTLARILIFVWFIFVSFASLAAAQSPDQLAAARILGPHWKRNARAAGMVFAGTVLSVEASARTQAVPTLQLKIRVERAIAGVHAGQVLTIREWRGALSTRPPMRPGQHLLLLLYPPSWLGLTSPVGGLSGQIALDANGRIQRSPPPGDRGHGTGAGTVRLAARPPGAAADMTTQQITVAQLGRAIRRAREE